MAPEQLAAWVRPLHGWLSRPRVRLTVTGLILCTGGMVMTNSVWTLPLVLVGATMILIAWIGHRLDGRIALEWGEGGAQLEFRAKINAPQPELVTSTRAHHVTEAIEGEAHTIEVDVLELSALIAAADLRPGGQADAAAKAADSLRVAGPLQPGDPRP